MECIVCLEEKETVKFDCNHNVCEECLEEIKQHNIDKCPCVEQIFILMVLF